MKKSILISVDFILQASFFIRFAEALSNLGYRVKYITYQWSAYKFLSDRVDKSALIYVHRTRRNKLEGERNFEDLPNESLQKDFEAVTGEYIISEIKRLYESVFCTVSTLDADDISYIFMWNGCRVSDHALTDFARENSIKTIFFELANIDGKVFVDPMGTNAKSYLYRHPEILQKLNFNTKQYTKWRKEYIENKLHQNTVKQAKRKTPGRALWNYLQDITGFYIHNGAIKRKFPLEKIRAWLCKPEFEFSSFDYKHEKYIFFPLQVSNDTQVLINGNMTLIEAVQYSINIAKQENAYLVIKPHPAESNPCYISGMRQILNSYEKVIFLKENTFELICYAERVITINSTVGLEALIADKKVSIIGRALYESFSAHDVAAYVMEYLIDADYWGNEDLSETQVRHILKRGDLCGALA